MCTMGKHNLTQSLENYLKAVYEICKLQKAARIKDIANYLKIGASSTSEAIKVLADKKYVNYTPYGIITLSAKGKKKAEEKITRHQTICRFLREVLLVDEADIEENAEKIEYAVSQDVLDKFIRFLTFMQTCSCKEPKWIKSYKYYSINGEMQSKCSVCIQNIEKFDNSNCCGGCVPKDFK